MREIKGKIEYGVAIHMGGKPRTNSDLVKIGSKKSRLPSEESAGAREKPACEREQERDRDDERLNSFLKAWQLG